MDEQEQEARQRGEQVTRCPDCGRLVADALLWLHQERHTPTPRAADTHPG